MRTREEIDRLRRVMATAFGSAVESGDERTADVTSSAFSILSWVLGSRDGIAIEELIARIKRYDNARNN